MIKTDGSITTDIEGGTREDFIFTHPDQELEQIKIDRANASLVFAPEFIPYYMEEVRYLNLTPIQGLIYGFVRFFLKNNNGKKFYFSSLQLSNILGCSESAINNGIKKLKDVGLIDTSRRQKSGGGTMRYINGVYTYDHLLKKVSLTYSNKWLQINKRNNKKKKKNNIHQSKFDGVFSSFGITKLNIEKWFKYKKSLDDIINICGYIKTLSNKIGITPIYNKDTINATHILRNRYELNDIDEFLDKLQTLGYLDGVFSSYAELIRCDQYLPEQIEKT